ncbi:MAG TPA: phenylalanine 4-monooxygenase [Solirubrobacteraceae bacterium]|jgi:phenylalanine-4-hydroxylase
MFEEAQLYSPVTAGDEGVKVHLASDHPGVADPVYRARRNAIAAAALDWEPGRPLPVIEYTEAEHEVWRIVCRELAIKHRKYAPQALVEASQRFALPTDRIPQLHEVNALLEPLTGFRYACAPGLVPLLEFLGALGDRVFHSTQYIRHTSTPLYTPEPDLIHEVIGHGMLMADPQVAEVKRLAGEAARRVKDTKESLKFLADVFWFTIEFGVLREAGEWRAYGAGILSSYGEIEEFRHMDIRPIDFLAMGTLEYDITHYQPILFGAESFDHMVDTVGAFFAGFEADTPERLRAEAAVV